MKKQISLIFVGLFVSCTPNVKEEIDDATSNLTSVSQTYNVAEVPCKDDSLVKVLFNNGLKSVKGEKLISEPDIKYTSGYSDDFSFTNYQLSFKENIIEFIDTIYEKSKIDKRNFYLNNRRLNVCKIRNTAFDLDSMEMHVVYTESEIYSFKNNPFYILVVSHPMNWVGTMTRFSLFQMINLRDKTIFEFIMEEE